MPFRKQRAFTIIKYCILKLELNIIHNILYNNSLPIELQEPPTHSAAQQQASQTSKHHWATFTYVGNEPSYIINIFRHTDLKIAFPTKNTIRNLLMHQNPAPNTFSLPRLFKLTCPDCNKAHVGQTEDASQYKHKQALRNNSNNPNSHNTLTNKHIPSAP